MDISHRLCSYGRTMLDALVFHRRQLRRPNNVLPRALASGRDSHFCRSVNPHSMNSVCEAVLTVTFTSRTAGPIELYFAYRVWDLSGSRVLFWIVVILTVITCGMAVVSTAYAQSRAKYAADSF